MIGKLFNDRYQIIEKIGSGGTAIVYKGQDTLLGRMVTVKILREECASNEEFVRRFRREAQAVASLSHGNIVAVYDVGLEENMQYIVMEFVEGLSLKEYIQQKGSLGIEEAAAIMVQILDGISYAHEHGIIHRDIKPHNILLGHDGRAKVTDFGIAIGMTDVTQTYNTSSKIMGSVHYIASEQVQGLAVTEKSDIYSAGVVFYEMLTGQLPFNGDTPISIAMQHVQAELILPHQLNPRIPIGLSYVIMRAMRKNPETRYESAKEMTEAIKGVVDGLSSIYQPAPDEKIDGGELISGTDARPNRRERRTETVRKRNNEGRKRSINFTAILLLIVVVSFVAALIWFVGKIGIIFEPETMIATPNMVGKEISIAETELNNMELSYTIERKNSDTVPINTIISQSPVAETSISASRNIILTVSDGPPLTDVPVVEGLSEYLAETRLADKGLTFVYNEPEYHDSVLEGDIIDQVPAAGTQVSGGTQVMMTVSKGPEPILIDMPTVTDLPLEEAQTALTNAKLLVAQPLVYEESLTHNEGIVIRQSAAAGSEVAEGDEITLVVSSGPGPVDRSVTINYTVINDGLPHNITVVISDTQGVREVWNQEHESGYFFNQSFTYYEKGIITIYLDNVAQQSFEVPQNSNAGSI